MSDARPTLPVVDYYPSRDAFCEGGSGARILLGYRPPDLCRFYAMALRREGHVVVAITRTAEVLPFASAILRAELPRPDIAVLSFDLLSDAPELVAVLGGREAPTPTIVTARAIDTEALALGVRFPLLTVLTSPISPSSLARVVRQAWGDAREAKGE